jgi:hypothetical protein
MPELEAQRTLVKSPPELWAEVSDATSLARHLGEVGDIRITRLEPETTVAWEGERASGTVAIAPAGWGTRVTLTADPIAVEERVASELPAPEPPQPAAEVEPAPAPPADRAGPPFAALFRRFRRRAPTTPPPAPPEPQAEPVEPEPEPAAALRAPDPLLGALVSALDSLGSAHHRPFSRG